MKVNVHGSSTLTVEQLKVLNTPLSGKIALLALVALSLIPLYIDLLLYFRVL